jgi:HPt (histidine-containing phosphotransfer) domain-containing protein
MSNNDEQFISDMIDSFIKNTPEILQQLEQAINEQNWQHVGDLAHKIKPNLAFLGIDSLKETVLTIELSGKNAENTEALPKQVEHLITKVNEALEELANLY